MKIYIKLKAYTVIELLIVILIMALLFAVAANNFYNIRQQRRDIVRIGDINNISNALEQYKLVEGNYPLMLTPGQPLVGEKSGLVFMDLVPESREYKRVNCQYQDYSYEYNPEDESYVIDFCFESNLDGYDIGRKCFVDGNIVEGFCSFVCGDVFVDDRDSQQYKTVQIGGQCWMAENLKYLPEVFPSAEGSTIAPFYYVYGYQGYNVEEARSTTNYNIHGVLYNWPATMASSITEGVQGVCPDGWHVPTDSEWKTLEGVVDSIYGADDPIWNTNTWRGSDVGVNLKSSVFDSPSWNGNNQFFFSVLPSGGRRVEGTFLYINDFISIWSSSNSTSLVAWARGLGSSYNTVRRFTDSKSRGFSVRCLKDY